MDVQDKKFAEGALKHLFVGSQLDAVKFSPGAILIRFQHYSNIHKEPGELWINIKTRWTVFPSENKDFHESEDEIDDLSEQEQYDLVFRLRRQKVMNIKLGELAPASLYKL
jgi:hypothetical protein